MKKETNEYWKNIVIIFIILLLILGMVNYVIKASNKAKRTIEECKSNGWDGARFESAIATKMICSNMTQREKDTLFQGGRLKK